MGGFVFCFYNIGGQPLILCGGGAHFPRDQKHSALVAHPRHVRSIYKRLQPQEPTNSRAICPGNPSAPQGRPPRVWRELHLPSGDTLAREVFYHGLSIAVSLR